MIKPPFPIDETARLRSLNTLRILDTTPEERYDRITRMGKRIFGVEICLISLVDRDRQWFLSKQGLAACETSREVSFCGHAILDEEILVVRDATQDPRFSDNPLVTDDPNIRFYAGCPLHGPLGYRIGTLCLIDSKVRNFDNEDETALRDLAALVEDQLRIASQATVDDLTGIANRRGFNIVGTHMLSLCQRTNAGAEMIVFDLDDFKQTNDTLGHSHGDAVLKQFANALLKCFRSADVVARTGGDEFVVMMTASNEASSAALERLATQLDCPKFSAGTAIYRPEIHNTVEDLFKEADSSLYVDKQARRSLRNR